MVDIRRMQRALALVATVSAVATGAALPSPASATGGPCVARTSCATQQQLVVSVLAGGLEQTMRAQPGNPNASFVRLGHTRVAHGHRTAFGSMNDVTVTDTRGGVLGWSLTASIAPLSNGRDTIAARHLFVSPTCRIAGPGSAPGATAGRAWQSAGDTVTLCTKDSRLGPTGSTGGTYEVGASLVLDLPQHARGHYTAVVQLTLA